MAYIINYTNNEVKSQIFPQKNAQITNTWQLGREKIQTDMNEITPSRREFSFVFSTHFSVNIFMTLTTNAH